MPDQGKLNSHTHGPASGGAPKQLVILLHGLGADGQDLIGLAPIFAQLLPDAVFVAPDAPFPCDMAPYGRQWFSLQSRDAQSILNGVQQANPILQAYIDLQLAKYHLTDADIALIGFSQGTMMSLYAGPRRPTKIAGILGYSGALVWEGDVQPETLPVPPIHLIHGDADEVVPFSAFHKAMGYFQQAGIEATGEVMPGLGHGIDEQGIKSGAQFLKRVFGVA